MFSYFRFRLFTILLKPFSVAMRQRRMAAFQNIFQPTAGIKVLDLGGQPAIWDSVKPALAITCLNLPGVAKTGHPTHHDITYCQGDACNMPEFNKGDFDLVFSNSVIEHVGDHEKQQQFAAEVQRLADNYWIQTPSIYFPMEAHCGMPFWWAYPKGLQQYFLTRWSKKLPAWSEMVATTTVLSKRRMKQLFPHSQLKTERLVFPKSIVAYSKK